MAKTEIICKYCSKEFMAENKFINQGNAKFCSVSCGVKYNRRAEKQQRKDNVECAYCKIKFYKAPARVALSKSGLFFCCSSHKNKAATAECGILQLGHARNGSGSYRKIALSNYKNECNRCKYIGKYLDTLVVHHKDRDRENNKLSNLEILCRNCHYEDHRNDFISSRKYIFDKNGNSVSKRKLSKQKIKWPNLDKLINMVNSSSYITVGKELGVSDTAVKKHIWIRRPEFKLNKTKKAKP